MAETTIIATLKSFAQRVSGAGETWSTIRSGDGTHAVHQSNDTVRLDADNTTDQYNVLGRGFLIFDTSTIQVSLSSGKVRLYNNGDFFSEFTTYLGVYSATPASEVAIVAADYQQLGTTPFTDSPQLLDGTLALGWFEITLNAAGLAYINRTGNTVFGLRFTHDADNTTPTWWADTNNHLQVEATISFIPELVVDSGIGLPYFIWTYGELLQFTNSRGIKSHVYGTDTLTDGLAKFLWVEGIFLYWSDQNGDIRRKAGMAGLATGATPYFIWIEGDYIHYIGNDGNEYYLANAAVLGLETFNTVGFNA